VKPGTARAVALRCAALLGVLATAFLVACGGESGEPVAATDFAARFVPPAGAESGGSLKVLASGDVDSLDPGALQNQFGFMVSFATQRTLFAASDTTPGEFVPDLAAGPAKVDPKRGTIDIRIKPDVRYSPPVSRPVVARDVEYSIERGLLPGVANGSLEAYLGSLRGFARAKRDAVADPRRAPDIAGVTALGSDLLRLRFEGVVPPLAVEALSLSFSSPVPPEYARQFDAEIPSTYARHVVSTGPYMVPNDEEGAITGHRPGIEIELVRNPSWRRATDFRPAYLDEIHIESGYTNTTAASNRILTGKSQIAGDFVPEPNVLERAAREYPEQLMMVPAGAILYAALNTTIAPLDDVDVRRAVVAAVDRTALALARGGSFVGPLATHFLPPGVPGFEAAGGLDGSGFDFLAEPSGDPDLAAGYMREAGYPEGKYSGGDEELSMVTDTTGIGRRTGEVIRRAFESLGFRVDSRAVTRDVMFSRFCNVPAAEIAICPNVGWVRQLDDGQTVLDQTFNGGAILPVNNSNWPQLDVPAVNRAIDRAKWIEAPADRAAAWARIDRMITGLAPAIPIVWSEIPSLSSADVVNVYERSASVPSLPMISLDPDGCADGPDC